MIEHSSASISPRTIRIVSVLFILILMAAMWIVVRPFLTPLLWAIVIVSATAPLYRRIVTLMPCHPRLAALLLTGSLGFLLVLVTVVVPLKVAVELRGLVGEMTTVDITIFAEQIGRLPIVGGTLKGYVEGVLADPEVVTTLLRENREMLLGVARVVVSGLSSTFLVVCAALVGSFLLFCNGETLAGNLQAILRRTFGHDLSPLLRTAHETVRGAAYSVVATAIVQGALAGVGYAVAGVPAPLLLSLLTMLLSLVPFGPPFLYVPAAAYLVVGAGAPWYYGLGLLVWGIGVVSVVDNILRPLFISQQSQLPTALVFIGVLGGVLAFGLLGVFLGPALMAIGHRVWIDFAEDGRLGSSITS